MTLKQQRAAPELESSTLHSGQILVSATVAHNAKPSVNQIFDIAQGFLHPYGRLFAFIKVPNPSKSSPFRAIAEFCDISHATQVIANCAHATTPEVHFAASLTK